MSELQFPPVPPECDLRGLPWMPVDTLRLLDSDLWAISTGEEFKAAFKLWCKAWQQVPASSLPDDDRILAELSGAGRRWAKVKPMALRGFRKCQDGRLYHLVIAEKAMEAWAHRQAQRDRAAKRWHPTGTATAHAAAHATASATAMQGTGTGKRQKPPSAARAAPTGFEEAWKALPKRAGNNPRQRAERAYRARLDAGCKPEEMLEGAQRYERFCRATGKAGSEFVMQGATFFGPEMPFRQPWTVVNGSPRWDANNDTILAEAKRLGISSIGCSAEELKSRIRAKHSEGVPA